MICAGIAHNLLRAAATLAGTGHRSARGATLRRHLVNIPARLARPQRKPILHLPTHWPWEPAWITLWHNTIGRRSSAKPPPARPDNQDPDRKSWADQRPIHAATSHNQDQHSTHQHGVYRWNQAKSVPGDRRVRAVEITPMALSSSTPLTWPRSHGLNAWFPYRGPTRPSS